MNDIDKIRFILTMDISNDEKINEISKILSVNATKNALNEKDVINTLLECGAATRASKKLNVSLYVFNNRLYKATEKISRFLKEDGINSGDGFDKYHKNFLLTNVTAILANKELWAKWVDKYL